MTTADFTWTLPADLEARVRRRLAGFAREQVVARIWNKDTSVWSQADEDRWLGWLTLPMQDRDVLAPLRALAEELKAEDVRHVVLLGMGGSSLAPEVMRAIVGRGAGHPDLLVVDSTDPVQIARVSDAVDLARTAFLVASKSGSTLEVNILNQYFYEQAVQRLGTAEAGRRFIVTTDPGSKMQEVAERHGYRQVFAGIPSVGGRYSALSNFGLVPAALIGAEPETMLDRAEAMAERCRLDGEGNSGLALGVLLGEAALAGRDKPTLVVGAALAPFGGWLEQLVAESLGKQGKGIIPIDGEVLGPPEVYGPDRVFVHLRLAGETDAAVDAGVDRLARAGHPVVRIDWPDRHALGAEFYRWEFATAVAGAVLDVNPFDQPDVEAAKVVTRRLAAEYEATGRLSDDGVPVRRGALSVYGDPAGVLGGLTPGDYFALLAFIEMSAPHRRALDDIRAIVRDRRRVATTVGFGPRYLHSTGQAHKGGPDSGAFLLVTADQPHDLPVPGQRYTFATIQLAQARGDHEVLAARGRRVLRVHLHDIETGLRELRALVEEAVPGRGVQ